MDYELKQVILDDKPVYKLKCPKCNVWGYLDDDQFNGRVSILCECRGKEWIKNIN